MTATPQDNDGEYPGAHHSDTATRSDGAMLGEQVSDCMLAEQELGAIDGLYDDADELINVPDGLVEWTSATALWASQNYPRLHNHILAMEARLATREDEITRLRWILEWYADEDNYIVRHSGPFSRMAAADDNGGRAREALDNEATE